MMDTTRTETALQDFEASTVPSDQVLDWDADVLEHDFKVTLWCIIVSKDG